MESRLRGHFEIVSGPNPNARWFKEVVKNTVIGSIISLAMYKIN